MLWGGHCHHAKHWQHCMAWQQMDQPLGFMFPNSHVSASNACEERILCGLVFQVREKLFMVRWQEVTWWLPVDPTDLVDHTAKRPGQLY